jgi:hypothetical protein
VTELQQISLGGIVEEAVGDGNGKRTDIDELFLADYGKSTRQLSRVLRMFRDLSCNVILTAHPKEVYPPNKKGPTETASPLSIRPMLTEKLSGLVMGYWDFVWYIEKTEDENGDEERWLYTHTDGTIKCKTRGRPFADALREQYPDGVQNPSMPVLYDLFCTSQGVLPPGDSEE